MTKIYFGDVKAREGEVARGRWRVLELSDGSWVEFPVMIINGIEDGPIVYLGALMHGDEYSGIGVLHHVQEALSPERMHGSVIMVPVQNPIAHRARGRLTLIVQSDTPNMHRAWPGSSDGDTSQRMAHLLFQELCNAGVSAVVDFHSGTTGHECAAHTFVPGTDGSEDNSTAERAFELASWFNLGVIMRATGGAYSNTSWMEHALCANGIPAFGVELGEGARMQPDFVQRGVQSTLDLLRHLEVIDGEINAPPAQRILVDEVWVRANRGGFVNGNLSSGSNVTRGQSLGHTVNVFGDIVEEFESPVDGFLLNVRKVPVISAGERLCRIGVEAD